MVFQRLGRTFRRAVMAAIDTGAPSSNGADVYNSPPSLFLHVRHCQLGDDEGTPEVHVDCVIPLVKIELENIADPLPIASVGNDYVGMLAMGFFDFVK
jgi:hypothetical protein